MLVIDQAKLDRDMNRMAAAIASATERSVFSMSMAAKDGLLDGIKRNVDRPSPFTSRPGAYQASRATRGSNGAIVSTFSIAPLQAGYLQFIMFDPKATRHAGEAGASVRGPWVPPVKPGSRLTKLTQYGGVTRNLSKNLYKMTLADKERMKASKMSESQFAMTLRKSDSMKASLRSRGRAPSSQGGVFIGHTGKVSVYGFWARPKRTGPKLKVDNVVVGPRMQATRVRGPNGRFAPLFGPTQPSKMKTVKDNLFNRMGRKVLLRPHDESAQVHSLGKPVLILEQVPRTHHGRKIVYDAIMQAASEKGADGFSRRLEDELRKRGFA